MTRSVRRPVFFDPGSTSASTRASSPRQQRRRGGNYPPGPAVASPNQRLRKTQGRLQPAFPRAVVPPISTRTGAACGGAALTVNQRPRNVVVVTAGTLDQGLPAPRKYDAETVSGWSGCYLAVDAPCVPPTAPARVDTQARKIALAPVIRDRPVAEHGFDGRYQRVMSCARVRASGGAQERLRWLTRDRNSCSTELFPRPGAAAVGPAGRSARRQRQISPGPDQPVLSDDLARRARRADHPSVSEVSGSTC